MNMTALGGFSGGTLVLLVWGLIKVWPHRSEIKKEEKIILGLWAGAAVALWLASVVLVVTEAEYAAMYLAGMFGLGAGFGFLSRCRRYEN